MAINLNKLINIIQPEVETDMMTNLIRNYLVLKYRMNHFDEQSWYFRQAKESNEAKLSKLKKSYEEHRIAFNELTNERILDMIAECEKNLKDIHNERTTPIFTRIIRVNICESKKATLKSYLHIRNKFDTLLPIDDYESSEEYLEKLFEV